jgi:hypothetical protein
LFSMFCFVVAIYCFTVVIIAAHVWLIVQILGRLLDRQWFRRCGGRWSFYSCGIWTA